MLVMSVRMCCCNGCTHACLLACCYHEPDKVRTKFIVHPELAKGEGGRRLSVSHVILLAGQRSR